jgi:hypothetical protein
MTTAPDEPADTVTVEPPVDAEALRAEVRDKYRQVAVDPRGTYHFHTGRTLAERLGYDPAIIDELPERAVESFAGVGNPFSLRPLEPGERVVDVGAGAGFDTFVAAHHVGSNGYVVGVDMTAEATSRARPPFCSPSSTSSSAMASPKRSRPRTAGRTWSSPMA